jgi:hypothetical protein
MLEQKKNAAIGIMLGALLVGATAVQASAQATQDTSKAAPTQDTSAYSAPARSDTSAAAGVTDTSAAKAGMDSTGMSKMGNDTTAADTSTKAGKKAWKKKHAADSTSAK